MRITLPEVGDDINSLISWLPPGHAHYAKNYETGGFSLVINGEVIIEKIEKGLCAWVAEMINATRGEQERHERYMLDQLIKKYGVQEAAKGTT